MGTWLWKLISRHNFYFYLKYFLLYRYQNNLGLQVPQLVRPDFDCSLTSSYSSKKCNQNGIISSVIFTSGNLKPVLSIQPSPTAVSPLCEECREFIWGRHPVLCKQLWVWSMPSCECSLSGLCPGPWISKE